MRQGGELEHNEARHWPLLRHQQQTTFQQCFTVCPRCRQPFPPWYSTTLAFITGPKLLNYSADPDHLRPRNTPTSFRRRCPGRVLTLLIEQDLTADGWKKINQHPFYSSVLIKKNKYLPHTHFERFRFCTDLFAGRGCRRYHFRLALRVAASFYFEYR